MHVSVKALITDADALNDENICEHLLWKIKTGLGTEHYHFVFCLCRRIRTSRFSQPDQYENGHSITVLFTLILMAACLHSTHQHYREVPRPQ